MKDPRAERGEAEAKQRAHRHRRTPTLAEPAAKQGAAR